jgi:putative ABC transport system permease protein
METLFKDIRYGMRALLKRPGFTIIAVLTLAIGIGANTAIFTVVNATLLRPLPFKDPDRVVMVWDYLPKFAKTADKLPSSSGNFVTLQSQNHVLDNLAAFRAWSWQSTGGEPEQLKGARVTADFFAAIGVAPALGQAFTRDDDAPGAAPVALISHDLWQRNFAADRSVIGKTLTLDGRTVRIVGVMPPGFRFPGGANLIPGMQFSLDNDLWLPLALTEKEKTAHGTLNLALIGRLKSGVTAEQAQTELRLLQADSPEGRFGLTVNLVPLHKQMVGNIQRLLLILLATVAFVLLIACANVANLLLARATSRRKEIAVLAALGATRFRLIRQFLTESVLLSLCGGLIGFLLAIWGNTLLVSLIPKDVPRVHEIGIDGRMLGFALLISLLTGIVFGLVPALQASRLDLNEALKEGARGTTAGFGQLRLRSLLVVSEIAMALVLLIGASLLLKSFVRLLKVDPGFDAGQVLTMEVQLPTQPPSRYVTDEQQSAFFQQLMDRITNLPGVTSAGGVVSLPLTGAFESTDLAIEGRPAPPAGQGPEADYTIVAGNYFQTLKIPLFAGRQFTAQDTRDAHGVVIINEAVAQRYWPNENPLGQRFTLGFEDKPREIVGVVGSIKQTAVNAEVRPAVYFPQSQASAAGMTVVVRTVGEPLALGNAVREQVRALDKDIPVSHLRPMDEIFRASVAQQRFSLLLVCLFAGLALALATLGIYGVMAYSVSQRSHEIGVRMALGAQSNHVLKLVLKNGMTLALAGIAIGLAGAFALTRLMTSLLFEVKATDAKTFAGVSGLLILVALLACYVPARRATKVDPLVALRYE